MTKGQTRLHPAAWLGILLLALLINACAPATPAGTALPQATLDSTATPAATALPSAAAATSAPDATAEPSAAATPTASPAASQPTRSAGMGAIPQFTAEVVLEGLDHPWDIVWLGDGSYIFSERGNKLTYVADGTSYELVAPEDAYVRGEGGLLGLAVDPDFAYHPYLYACFNSTASGQLDVRVARWEFDPTERTLSNRTDILTGLPSNTSGRHSGCQPAFGPDGYLWVSTGDTANGTVAQDPASLGGKILRIDRNGAPASNNLGAPYDPRIYSYGHRNSQGLGFFGLGALGGLIGINIEHGPGLDDEVNPLLPGNFGWNPVPGYNESVPMTDLQQYPDAVAALWSSGSPTLATSGGTVIQGAQWGAWDNAVAVAALKASRVVILELADDLSVARETQILQGEYGRIRTVQQGSDGYLYLLTDNGGGNDKIIRLVPAQ